MSSLSELCLSNRKVYIKRHIYSLASVAPPLFNLSVYPSSLLHLFISSLNSALLLLTVDWPCTHLLLPVLLRTPSLQSAVLLLHKFLVSSSSCGWLDGSSSCISFHITIMSFFSSSLVRGHCPVIVHCSHVEPYPLPPSLSSASPD